MTFKKDNDVSRGAEEKGVAPEREKLSRREFAKSSVAAGAAAVTMPNVLRAGQQSDAAAPPAGMSASPDKISASGGSRGREHVCDTRLAGIDSDLSDSLWWSFAFCVLNGCDGAASSSSLSDTSGLQPDATAAAPNRPVLRSHRLVRFIVVLRCCYCGGVRFN